MKLDTVGVDKVERRLIMNSLQPVVKIVIQNPRPYLYLQGVSTLNAGKFEIIAKRKAYNMLKYDIHTKKLLIEKSRQSSQRQMNANLPRKIC